MGSPPPILHYAILPAEYVEYDPQVVPAARRVVDLITSAAPWTHAEHIGSTAVPGCAGKGILDLMVLYPPGQLAKTRAAIDALGFQHQRSGHACPEHRPVPVGAIEHGGRIYRVHRHVIASNSSEALDLRRCRDALRNDPALCAAYQACKRAILQFGVNEAAAYTRAKGEFISAVMGRGRRS